MYLDFIIFVGLSLDKTLFLPCDLLIRFVRLRKNVYPYQIFKGEIILILSDPY